VVCQEVRYYYFGHFCVWVSGPELADHIRTDTRGFGLLLVLLEFPCCVYFQYLLAAFFRYSVYLYIQIYLTFILFLIVLMFGLYSPPFIAFVILPDPRVAGGGVVEQ
jgi:hypothetical protein